MTDKIASFLTFIFFAGPVMYIVGFWQFWTVVLTFLIPVFLFMLYVDYLKRAQ